MKENPIALTLDFGTQSVRTALIDCTGEIKAIKKKTYDKPYFSKEKGYAEQDPDFYWETAFNCLEELTKENKNLLPLIVGASITTFRDTSVQLDENNKPIRPCILWLDQRMAKAKEKLPYFHTLAFSLVGMTETINLNRRRTAAHWLKENEPDIWSKTKKYVNISTYLIYKLTGRLADSPSSLTGHYPLNFKKRQWYKDGALKGNIFGIKSNMLCDLVQPCEVIASIKDEIADELGLPHGIKVYATGSDKACETLGLGALSKDCGAISYGTASTIEVSNQKYHEPEKFLPAYPAAVPNWYNMDVQIYRGYWMLTWFSKNFAGELKEDSKMHDISVEELLNYHLSDVPPGSDGLVLQPYWGPGLSRPLAKGAIIGFSDIHTRAHLYRAIIEGIAYALKEGLEGIEKSQRHKVNHLMISGGGSQNDQICQITADIFDLPVSRVQTYETTSIGCATSIFLGAGIFKDIQEGMTKMSHVTTTFYPNEVASQQYKYLYRKVYLQMYPQLQDVYKDINAFAKKHS